MVQIALLIVLIATIFISLNNIKLGVVNLIIYKLLVPYTSFTVIKFEYNYAVLAVFFIWLIKNYKGRNIIYTEFSKPLIIFTTIIFLSILFSSNLAYTAQLNYLRVFIISNFLIPIMVWKEFKNLNDLNKLINYMLICSLLMSIYGLYCFFTNTNPYVTFLTVVFNSKDNFSVFSQSLRGGLLGRVQSTTFHPFLWSSLIMMLSIALNSLIKLKGRFLIILIWILLVINLFVSGTRSGIIGFLLGIPILLNSLSLYKKILISFSLLIFIIFFGFDTSFFGKYKALADSIIFFYDSSKSVGGSSLDLRLEQLDGALKLWSSGGLFAGNGFGWCSDYYEKYGDHPVLLAFESILYIALVDSGFLGIISWSLLFIMYIRLNLKLHKKNMFKDKNLFWSINALIFSYIIFLFITGLFGLNFFLIILVLLLNKYPNKIVKVISKSKLEYEY